MTDTGHIETPDRGEFSNLSASSGKYPARPLQTDECLVKPAQRIASPLHAVPARHRSVFPPPVSDFTLIEI
jgi:hypothetical protein